jgi:hypothetical protein
MSNTTVDVPNNVLEYVVRKRLGKRDGRVKLARHVGINVSQNKSEIFEWHCAATDNGSFFVIARGYGEVDPITSRIKIVTTKRDYEARPPVKQFS